MVHGRGFQPHSQLLSTCVCLAREEEEYEHRAMLKTVQKASTPAPEIRNKEYIQKKGLMQAWMEGTRPTQRIGIYSTNDPSEISRLTGIPVDDVVKQEHHGKFAVEVPLERGQKHRERESLRSTRWWKRKR